MWIINMEAKFFIIWTVTVLAIYITNVRGGIFNTSEVLSGSWPTESELENELEQKRAKNTQWSPWSNWSTCSRSCDGGISQQIRRCNAPNGCKGDNIRFRICNMQPCPEQQDFRALQCLAFNDVPYDGVLYKWTPHYDYSEPCSLFCRGRPAHLPDDESTIHSDGDELGHFDEPSVIVQLSNRVQDGTRCRMGSLDMCIQGKCQRVGCDLKIGSMKKVDACGVCGGDGTTCTQPLYHWDMTPMSLCSATCGGGYKMSQPICKNRVTGYEVEDSLCSGITRPEPSVVQCNTHTCPPRWFTDEWSVCNRQCGGGIRVRPLVCAEENNGVKTVVPKELCTMSKPQTREECNMHECPQWMPTEWSGCSVSCGTGIQIRGVECLENDGTLSTKCEPHNRPAPVQECTTGISCDDEILVPNGRQQKQLTSSALSSPSSSSSSTSTFSQSSQRNNPDIYKSSIEDDEDTTSEDDDDNGDDEEEDTEPDSGQTSYNDQPIYSYRKQDTLQHEEQLPRAEKRVSEQRPSSEPTYIQDTEWSACSVTCGEGIRRKEWKCKIFLEYSKTVATVNNSLCEGPPPKAEIEHCVMDPCMLPYGYDDQYPRDSIKVGVSEPGKTYVWREQGYTSCSASCLGGVEELIINCVREDNGRVVSPFLCSPETKPEARVRTCNDRPCPPRWNYSDYSPCSKSCGIGIKTREVQCIHEVTRGGENTMVVPNNMCPQPPPPDRQYCNVLDCPVRWEVGEWSKCSHTCGQGVKERKVECKQIMAQEHKIERPVSMCPSAKPATTKPCNVKACPPEDPKPIIQVSNSTYKQHDPKKNKISLKIGGAAEVFFGTQVKIKCPVKRYNRTKIRWSKDHKPLPKSRKFKVSKKGALRILDITFRDSGIYSCHAGLSSAEINIDVKAKPGMQVEDYDRHRDESDRSVRERSETEFLTSADMTSEDSKKKQKDRNNKEKSRLKSGDGMQHADSSIMEDESQLIQQAQGGIPPPTTATSSGSRSILKMPYFEALLASLQFLWPFQKFRNSRGHHMLIEKGFDYGFELEQLEKDEPVKPVLPTLIAKSATKSTTASNTHTSSASMASTSAKNLLIAANKNETGIILGHGTKDDIQFEWMATEWTECSIYCGAGGLRRRQVYCMVKLENKTQRVDNALCEDAGIEIPDTFESCGNYECPQWESGLWTKCQKSRCLRKYTAIQRREIICKFSNSTLSNKCEENERPIERQECFNKECRGIWRVEPWSECNAACGKQGIKYRILRCVWHGTRRPAGNACRDHPRPTVMKTCKGPPCLSNLIECADTSKYCKNVRIMGLCRLYRYRQKCCKSCRNFISD
ncbi:protein madd-4 [Condylostylus longicornis]|uniref:protein madd-4 n=1 Tax=Condylostylus longicornis TaxID=2530218 RepID=UPI00244DCF00|nr:protein madd-4 [Condylostylus longicornis]XP_055381953.1 protein madd-4 [Condylostylus longicornis]XP_055381954.1 protein madd-4 [Condylostylus longicornis]XP_055381955.1 protein madd-4 [Condylostylus longicornis]XP_055381957.1 protein madd-4 [Condylostylus longicornis]XP_055381958.1 protein madd-4 [Condylostylus longicornis]